MNDVYTTRGEAINCTLQKTYCQQLVRVREVSEEMSS